MTRTNKANDRDHAGLAEGTAEPMQHMPRYFAKSGHVGEAPNKIKKEGGGKGNWGHPGEEAQDTGYTFAASRRRSNSTAFKPISDFTTKFEAPEEDPFFEDHMGNPDDYKYPDMDDEGEGDLKKHENADTLDSASTGSVSAGSYDGKD